MRISLGSSAARSQAISTASAGRLAAPHQLLALEQLVEQAQQVLVAGSLGQRRQLLGVLGRQVEPLGIGADRGVQRVAAVGEELVVDVARVPALVLDARRAPP